MHFTTAPLDQNLVEIVPKMVPYISYQIFNWFDSWLMADGTVLVLTQPLRVIHRAGSKRGDGF